MVLPGLSLHRASETSVEMKEKKGRLNRYSY
jgi:hypothetical protein